MLTTLNKKGCLRTAFFYFTSKNYVLFFFFAAFAARFSFRLSTGSFLAEFFEGDFSFGML